MVSADSPTASPHPTDPARDFATVVEMVEGDEGTAPDGCPSRADGACPHGHQAVLAGARV